MATSIGRKSLTIEDVEEELSFMKLCTFCTKFRIEIPQNPTVPELKQLIIRHLQNGGTKKPSRLQEWNTTSAATHEDLSNRTQLRQFYEKSLAYVETLPDALMENLNQLFPGCVHQMKEFTKELSSSKCTLMIAGEMGAGKSSLVNLLLGVPILPTSDLRCTAAIVEVSYGDVPRAEMYFRDDSSGRSLKPIKIESSTFPTVSREFSATLEEHITKRDPETDESPYEKIRLSWPLDVLKGGVTIVDSPGVGDSRNLPQELAYYMKQAFGFIYVIDSTAAVHRHRLGQLLLKAIEANGNIFDPDTALFVCNRWDMILPDESEKVMDSLTDRLSMILPGIKRSQIFPISVKNSYQMIEYGNVSADHKRLIEGMQQFLPKMMRGKLRIYYRYLSLILKRSLYCIRFKFNTSRKSAEELQREANDFDQKIGVLQKNTDDKLDRMRLQLKSVTLDASHKIMQHLESLHTRPKLITWRDTDCPRKDSKWQNVLKSAMLHIGDRVAGEINRWEQTTDFEDKVVKGIVEQFERDFKLFIHEVKDIEEIFIERGIDRNAVLDFHRSMKQPTGQKKPAKTGKKSKETSILSLGATIASVCTLDAKNSDIKKLFKDRFEREPGVVMAAATEMSLICLTESTIYSTLTKHFERYMKGIAEGGKLMPTMLKSNQNLLNDVSKNLTSLEYALKFYPPLSKKCSDIQGALDMFFLQRLLATDFTSDQLQYDKEKDKLGDGSFATVYKAKLTTRSGVKVVALKEPKECINIQDVTDLLLEESMLREVDHVNIVKYFGMYRKGPDGSLRLNMVMEHCPSTLKSTFLSKGAYAPSKFGDNPERQMKCVDTMAKLLLQIINGLSYLHGEGIVHRDLKPENVLLTSNTVVKIADLGLAKKEKEIMTVGIGTPVYMAPEVLLLSDKYNAKADIYSFAMIAWELWYGTDLAHYAASELQGGLKVSIEKEWRPSLTIVTAPTEYWKDLIRISWSQVPRDRPNAREIGNSLKRVIERIQMSKSQQRGLTQSEENPTNL